MFHEKPSNSSFRAIVGGLKMLFPTLNGNGNQDAHSICAICINLSVELQGLG